MNKKDNDLQSKESGQSGSKEDSQQNAEMSSKAPNLEELEAEIARLKDTVLRLSADNENIRKRFAKELEESNNYAINGFAKDIVEILENLNRALDNITTQEEKDLETLKPLTDGVMMTKKVLEDIFQKHGIIRLYPVLEKFDHNHHQAISQAVDNEKEPNTILQVIQAGYKIKDRLLKPALVVVSKVE